MSHYHSHSTLLSSVNKQALRAIFPTIFPFLSESDPRHRQLNKALVVVSGTAVSQWWSRNLGSGWGVRSATCWNTTLLHYFTTSSLLHNHNSLFPDLSCAAQPLSSSTREQTESWYSTLWDTWEVETPEPPTTPTCAASHTTRQWPTTLRCAAAAAQHSLTLNFTHFSAVCVPSKPVLYQSMSKELRK